jgi:hypothetical protein
VSRALVFSLLTGYGFVQVLRLEIDLLADVTLSDQELNLLRAFGTPQTRA